MSDTQTPAEQGQEPAATGQVETLPDWAREAISKANGEAAKYRTEKNDAVTAAKEAVNQEWATKVSDSQARSAALEADLGDAWVYAAKLEAAVNAGVPTDKVLAFAKFLKGSDEASIKESAESAKALFGIGTQLATDPTQGSGGVPPVGLNSDALLSAVTAIVNGK